MIKDKDNDAIVNTDYFNAFFMWKVVIINDGLRQGLEDG